LQTDFLNVNKKLLPKWIGPATIIEINESVAKLKLQNNRHKTLNVKCLKLSIPRENKECQDEQDIQDGENTKNDAKNSNSNQNNTQINLKAFQNNRPHTCLNKIN
jgi:hypothetical protein